MSLLKSLTIVHPSEISHSDEKVVHVPIICSSEWILKECVPVMKWVIDAANEREDHVVRDPLDIAGSESLPKNIDSGSLLNYVKELCMFEVLSDELSPLKDTVCKPISPTQENCVTQYELSVVILLSEVLVCESNVTDLGESVIDLFDYCMRKVRRSQNTRCLFAWSTTIHCSGSSNFPFRCWHGLVVMTTA